MTKQKNLWEYVWIFLELCPSMLDIYPTPLQMGSGARHLGFLAPGRDSYGLFGVLNTSRLPAASRHGERVHNKECIYMYIRRKNRFGQYAPCPAGKGLLMVFLHNDCFWHSVPTLSLALSLSLSLSFSSSFLQNSHTMHKTMKEYKKHKSNWNSSKWDIFSWS